MVVFGGRSRWSALEVMAEALLTLTVLKLLCHGR